MVGRSTRSHSIRLGKGCRKRTSSTESVGYCHGVGSGNQAAEVLSGRAIAPVVRVRWHTAGNVNFDCTRGIAEAAGDIGLHIQGYFHCRSRACAAYRLETYSHQIVVRAIYEPWAVINGTDNLVCNDAAVYGAVPVTFCVNFAAIWVEINHHKRISQNRVLVHIHGSTRVGSIA